MSEQIKQRYAIIGAGAAGLSAAWDIARAGHEVTVYEAGSEVGGLAAGFKEDGWDWYLEKFYHHWFESDTEIFQLADELGVRDKIIFPRPKTSYWIDGELYRSEMTPYSVLFVLPVSLATKIRMSLAGAYLKYLTPNWRGLEQITVDDWMARYMGEEAYDTLFKPLMIGKFSDRYQTVNMAWMWARIKARSVKLGIFEGGFQAFLNKLAEGVRRQGAVIRLSSPVKTITPQQGGGFMLTADGETQVFDKVISTTSPHLLLKMTEALRDSDYARQVDNLESIGALCVVFALDRTLLEDGTYWLNLPATSPDKTETRFPFLALVEHTNFIEKSHYGDNVLVYCGDYVPPDHEYFQISEDELAERFMAVLPNFNPQFSPEWVRKTWVFRAPYAQPVPGLNHSEKIPDLTTPVSGLYWASMSQVYPWDRGTNYAVEIGRRVARLAMEG